MRAMLCRFAAVGAVLVLLAGGARVQAQEYFRKGGNDSLDFTVDRERNSRQKVLIASLFGGSILLGGVGLLFHIDSRNKSDDVSTDAGRHTGRIYTEELEDIRRSAIHSRNFAIASYALSGGLLVGTFIAYLLTDPGQETVRVRPEPARRARLMLAPTEGGALVGGAWRF
jgi:hypothetical protein